MQSHFAATHLLLGHRDKNGDVSLALILILKRSHRPLDVGHAAVLACEGRQNGIDLLPRQKRVAFDNEARDVEKRALRSREHRKEKGKRAEPPSIERTMECPGGRQASACVRNGLTARRDAAARLALAQLGWRIPTTSALFSRNVPPTVRSVLCELAISAKPSRVPRIVISPPDSMLCGPAAYTMIPPVRPGVTRTLPVALIVCGPDYVALDLEVSVLRKRKRMIGVYS